MPPLSLELINHIQANHALQLSQFVEPELGGIPDSAKLPVGFTESVFDWVDANPGAIRAAQAARES
jgi:hypothetical protein